MTSVVSLKNVNKIYQDGFNALTDINLDINHGEIFALLGPNGAGKTTIISMVCGLTNITSGTIKVCDFNVLKDYKKTRDIIGLVPQEISVEAFETVWAAVSFSRGIFGKPANPKLIEQILKDLSLWDKRKNKIMTLSGGMKRRVMIAKALAHEPKVLFLDEPTAGVDVELRKDMWRLVLRLREKGVTIILTTHYIEEAQAMADRVGVICEGKLIMVDNKDALMKRLGKKHLILELEHKIPEIPNELKKYSIDTREDKLIFSYDNYADGTNIKDLIKDINDSKINFKNLQTKESSLEEIFVELVRK